MENYLLQEKRMSTLLTFTISKEWTFWQRWAIRRGKRWRKIVSTNVFISQYGGQEILPDETKGGVWSRVIEVLESTSEGTKARVGKDREERMVWVISIVTYHQKSQKTTSKVDKSRNNSIRLLLAPWMLSWKKKKKRKRWWARLGWNKGYCFLSQILL